MAWLIFHSGRSPGTTLTFPSGGPTIFIRTSPGNTFDRARNPSCVFRETKVGSMVKSKVPSKVKLYTLMKGTSPSDGDIIAACGVVPFVMKPQTASARTQAQSLGISKGCNPPDTAGVSQDCNHCRCVFCECSRSIAICTNVGGAAAWLLRHSRVKFPLNAAAKMARLYFSIS